MRPCLTLLSGCSEGERRDRVTHWDITHIHVHIFMHTHTFRPPPTHTGKHNKGINFHLFISQFPTRCAWLHKTGWWRHPKSWQNMFILNSSPQSIATFTPIILEDWWTCLSLWIHSGLTEVLYFSLQYYLLHLCHSMVMFHFMLVHFSVTVEKTLSLWGVQHFMFGVRPGGQEMYTSHTQKKLCYES